MVASTCRGEARALLDDGGGGAGCLICSIICYPAHACVASENQAFTFIKTFVLS